MVLCLVIVGGRWDVMQWYCVLPSLVVEGCNAMVLCLVIVGGRGDVMQWYCVLSSLVVQGM